MHSGMIVSEFPLESVPASVELRFSSLSHCFGSLAHYRFCRWGQLDIKASVVCPYSVFEPVLLRILVLNGRIMCEGTDPESAMVAVPGLYLREQNDEKSPWYPFAFPNKRLTQGL